MTLDALKPTGCNALDVAALWPATAQTTGLPLPELEKPRREDPRPEEEKAWSGQQRTARTGT